MVFALGTRLQDFITGSWTVFAPETRFVSLNTARFDAVKHRALAIVGDVREGLADIDDGLGNWRANPEWLAQGQADMAKWNALVDQHQAPDNALSAN
ncbi:hypothetical protein [Mesorhizobium shangrilense]|uniref:Uncharacterized protein n=1 Tax=Mesorhizobium shangrilense TaxID=460060 RepID=A0ABV2DM72_9HYPH